MARQRTIAVLDAALLQPEDPSQVGVVRVAREHWSPGSGLVTRRAATVRIVVVEQGMLRVGWQHAGAGSAVICLPGSESAPQAGDEGMTGVAVVTGGAAAPGLIRSHLGLRPGVVDPGAGISALPLAHRVMAAARIGGRAGCRAADAAWRVLVAGLGNLADLGGRRAEAWATLERLLGAADADGCGLLRGDRLAAAVGVDRAYASRLFKRFIDESPAAYLRRARIFEAARMLEGGGYAAASVARRVGYADAAAFHRAFVAVMGMPPGAWSQGH